MNIVSGLRQWSEKAFHISILKKKRLEWVDYLRGIAIILVVYNHARTGIEGRHIAVPESLIDANMIFYSFRMPLFFMLSGIFINRSLQKKPVGEIAGMKFEKLLYPYLIWAVIQISLQIIFSQFANSSRTPHDFLYIFYHPRHLDQFWYLPALFNASMFYLLVRTKFNPGTGTHLGLGLVLFYLSPYFQNVSMLSDWMEFYIFLAIGSELTGFFFRDSSQKFLNNLWSFIIIIPIFVAAQLFYLKYNIGYTTLLTDVEYIKQHYLIHIWHQTIFLGIALIGCLTMFKVGFLLQRTHKLSFLRLIGYFSLQIYVLHVIVSAFSRTVLTKFLHLTNPAVILFTGIILGVMVPIMIYNLFIKDNVGWFLFTYRRKKRKQDAPAPAPAAEVKADVRTNFVTSKAG